MYFPCFLGMDDRDSLDQYLFVKALQLHLQGLQEALSLAELVMGAAQGLIALPHLCLHSFQLKHTRKQCHTHTETHICLARSRIVSVINATESSVCLQLYVHERKTLN